VGREDSDLRLFFEALHNLWRRYADRAVHSRFSQILVFSPWIRDADPFGAVAGIQCGGGCLPSKPYWALRRLLAVGRGRGFHSCVVASITIARADPNPSSGAAFEGTNARFHREHTIGSLAPVPRVEETLAASPPSPTDGSRRLPCLGRGHLL